MLHERPHHHSGIITAKIGDPIRFSIHHEHQIHPTALPPVHRLHTRTALYRVRRIQLHVHIDTVPHRPKLLFDGDNVKSSPIVYAAFQSPCLVGMKDFFLHPIIKTHGVSSYSIHTSAEYSIIFTASAQFAAFCFLIKNIIFVVFLLVQQNKQGGICYEPAAAHPHGARQGLCRRTRSERRLDAEGIESIRHRRERLPR